MRIRKSPLAAVTAAISFLISPAVAGGIADGTAFIGEVRLFAGNFAPRGWAFCDGQLLAISQHDALFSILGTTYGGDGRTTFALPDLRGRMAIGVGTGPGLPNYRLGAKGGTDHVTLLSSHLPPHTHGATVVPRGSDGSPDATSPTGAAFAVTEDDRYAANADATMAAGTVTGNATSQIQGGNQPHLRVPPQMALRYIISLFGIYPSRN